ncbi:MAG: SOS response-associated peptidase [Gammaproteobacteria bacterium]|nr:SOS response-associated peptidase [Gammaproteobacteria bacterium]
MCGRYLLRNQPEFTTHNPWREFWDDISQIIPRFNIAPSQKCPLIVASPNGPQLAWMTWGFRPTWAKSSFTKINARSESVADSKMFGASFKTQRCLVPADGFFEPEGEAHQKNRPWHLFEYSDQRAFMMAGIWTTFDDGKVNQDNFCILTTEANELVGAVHHRMPLILDESSWKDWLNTSESQTLAPLMQSKSYVGMQEYAVTDTAKNPSLDNKQCIEPAGTPKPGDNLSLF